MLTFDTSNAEKEIGQIIQLLKSRFPKGVPCKLLRDFECLRFDVAFRDSRSALRANGTVEVFESLGFGGCLQSFAATFRANEGNHVRNFT